MCGGDKAAEGVEDVLPILGFLDFWIYGVMCVEVGNGGATLGVEDMIYAWCDCWYGIVLAKHCRGVEENIETAKRCFP